jgi:hypothetical protein
MLHRDPTPAKSLRDGDDPIKAQLKKAIRRDPRRRARFLIALAMLALVACLAAWWLWPRTAVPPLVVVAFDELVLGQRQTTLRAATEPLDGTDVRWGAQEVFFEEMRGLAPGASGTTKKATCDADGLAQIAWQFPGAAPVAEMEVRYLDERQRPAWSDRDHGRVYFWNADDRILVVDIEPTLKGVKDGDGVVQAMTAAVDKGWKIVHLAVSAERPLAYRQLRASVRQLKYGEAAFQPPVLGRKTFFQGGSEAEARKQVLADLKNAARGPILYVSADPGIKLQTVAGDGVPGTPIPVADWAALGAALPQ